MAIKPDFYIPRSLSFGVEAEGKVGFEVTSVVSLPLGFEYYRKGYYNRKSHEFNFFPSPSDKIFNGSAKWTGDVSAKAFIRADLGLGFDFKIVPAFSNDIGIKGLGFEGKLNAGFEIEPLNKDKECTVAEFYGNVTAKANVKLFIDGWFGKSWEWNFLPEGYSLKAKKQLLRHDIISKKATSELCIDSPESGKATLTLKWKESTDLDIFLKTQNGLIISPALNGLIRADGARLVQDACYKENECEEGVEHVELIEWDKLEDGDYEVWVMNYDGRNSANYKLEMTYPSGEKVSRSGQLYNNKGAKSEVFKFSYPN